MKNKYPTKFDAVIAKNEIAREIREYINAPQGKREPIHILYIISNLEDIEKYLGQMNQPSVRDIIDSTMEL